MRDLYKLIGLRAGASADDIARAIERSKRAPASDLEDARHVLLDASKKSVYDRTHRTLTTIGRLRAGLDLNDHAYWRGGGFSDFTLKSARPRARQFRMTRSAIVRTAAAALVLIALAGYARFHDSINEYVGAAMDNAQAQSTHGMVAKLRAQGRDAYDALRSVTGAACGLDYALSTHVRRTEYAIAYSICRSNPEVRASDLACRAKAEAHRRASLEHAERDYRTCREKR